MTRARLRLATLVCLDVVVACLAKGSNAVLECDVGDSSCDVRGTTPQAVFGVTRPARAAGTAPMAADYGAASSSKVASRWEGMWGSVSKGTRWDVGDVTPPLQWVLDTAVLPDGSPVVPSSGRVFIPGCGRAYDAVACASAERSVVALDIAPTAVAEAKAVLLDAVSSGKVTAAIAAQVSIVEGDFYLFDPSTAAGGAAPADDTAAVFDAIWDNTFACTVEPSMRESWAQRSWELLKPGGRLITNIFPLPSVGGYGGSERKDPLVEVGSGPPYTLSQGLIEMLLLPRGFELVLAADPPRNTRGRERMERVCVWQKPTSATVAAADAAPTALADAASSSSAGTGGVAT